MSVSVRDLEAGFVAWPAEAAARYRDLGYWAGRPLGDWLTAGADADPGAPAVIDTGVRLTHAELIARVDGAAQRMRALGLAPGDRIVLQLPNCWEQVVLLLACLRLGVVPALAVPAHRRQEIAAVVAAADARALIVPDVLRDFDHQAMATDIAAGIAGLDHVLVLGAARDGNVDARALCAPADDPAAARAELDAIAPDSSSIALFLLSGGTTGMPKLIARTHDDYAYMVTRSAHLCGFDRDTVYLAVLPLGYGYPMAGPGWLGALVRGGRVVIAASPAPERAFALIERERVTVTSLVPAAAQRWLEHRERDASADLSSLRLLQCAASRLADHVAERIPAVLGCSLQQVYGMSEGLLCFTRPDDPDEVVFHSQGRPICPDDELRVVDEDGRDVPDGEPGILLTRGPYTARGYYGASPELNARSFADGWYRTGDIVRRRPDGNLVIEGRDKDLIVRAGEKISAEEVENYAYQVPGVRLCAAVAMPDAEVGERICLYVIADRAVTVDEVCAVMNAAGVAKFKLPERVVLVRELPATGVGKIDKKALRADIARRLDQQR
ncbi:AMP-binding protein [Dactylosporangium sp. NPDC051485]|uniref:(2,3-dihydroxybenzoyl)adenylate synthase n=1 Tax=Dactylosporangium sp. NPDC051485 TaxID=3154846 RepID=UPI00341A617D